MHDRLDLKTISKFSELETFLNEIPDKFDVSQIRKAFEFAELKHKDQFRLSGEAYIIHPLTVAKYAVQIGLDQVSVISALLHDTVEDCGVEISEIEKLFGIDVAYIVDGLTNIKNLTDKEVAGEIDNFRKMILKASDDIRIVLIKLCDKLHNLYTIAAFDFEKQIRSAKKVKRIWEPISEYLGIIAIKREFQNITFKILEPVEFAKAEIVYKNYVEDKIAKAEEFKVELEELLQEYNLQNYKIDFRVESLGSFYDKLKRSSNSLSNITYDIMKVLDIFAFRILVIDIISCYEVLGLINSNFEFIKEQLDDYIVNPKKSGYKSLHTTLKYQNLYIEIQIKTYEMHEYNEFGPASHIAYKLGGKDYAWTKEAQEALSQEDYKAKLFKNKIFVFTPKSRVIILEQDSTPIDFAYQVHTEIGDSYIGAKVNEKMVNSEYKLQTGDVVEILTDKNKKSPSRDLLNLAKMTETKSRIRRRLNLVQ